jgi:hypothetical protein
MSKAALEAFLKELDENLKKKGGNKKSPSAIYRRLTANKLAHRFLITDVAIRRALFDATEKSINVSPTRAQFSLLKQKWQPFIEAFIVLVKENIETYAKRNEDVVTIEQISSTKTRYEIKLYTKEGESRDIFNILTTQYKGPLDTFYTEAIRIIQEVTDLQEGQSLLFIDKKGEFKQFGTGNIFNLEHNQRLGSSNVDAFKNDSIVDALNTLDVLTDAQRKDLDDLGVRLGIGRLRDLKKFDEIKVFLGSGVANNKASSVEGKVLRDLSAAIAREIGRLDIPELKGSDSVKESNRKVVARKVLKPYKRIKGKNIKTTFESLDMEGPKKSGATLEAGGKVKQGPTKEQKYVKKKSPRRRKRGSSVSLISLIPLLNRDLPEKIEQLMGTPALNYRTGRFARSVEVREITTTRQGYPSIGYTYQKNPYQTFEPGFAQGSPDRDPRTLITRAMRELMVNYAIGRFYTRRI